MFEQTFKNIDDILLYKSAIEKYTEIIQDDVNT